MVDQNKELRRLFDGALELSKEARASYLERECAGDAELKQRVLGMLAALEDDRFLSAPTGIRDDSSLIERPTELQEGPGTRIGPYKLLEQIGEGGFGVVFMAEQEQPVVRRVALKVIKFGMDTRQVVARFEQERQALALMDHPNIARVIDAGATETGRPYFVMELVKGEPIAQYCDKNRLALDERLELFAQVCLAVQHAHSKGLIHRDIKPSNILVGTQDGRPAAKVIDFGIAKATSSKLTDKTLFTEHNQVVGTLQYMSPEQAQGSLDIDTRSDVYSLGVVLYELLTGTTPFDIKTLLDAGYGEIQRVIAEEEPPKPSTRLRESAESLANVAAQRRVEPKRLGLLVRGELDWIVMKALEKDRARRYESAGGLASDVRRYVSGEAVVAAPPSAAYRFNKFVRRNKGKVTAAALVTLALVLGLVGTAWQARQAARQRDIALAAQEGEMRQRLAAEQERDKAEIVAEFMGDTLAGAGPSVARGRDVTMLKEMMDLAAERIERGELADAPGAELRLRRAIGTTYRRLALYPEAVRMLEPAETLARSLHAQDHSETAGTLNELAELFLDQGELARAEELFRESLEMLQRVYPDDHPDVAGALKALGSAVYGSGDIEAALELFRESNAMYTRLYEGDHLQIARTLSDIATVLEDQNGLADAEQLRRESLAMLKRLFQGDHPAVANGLESLATLKETMDDFAQAESLARESLAMTMRLYPGDTPEVVGGLNNLSSILRSKGDREGAEELLRESLEMSQRLYSGDHPYVATGLSNLAGLLMARGDLDDAEDYFRESIAMKRRLYPEGSQQLAIGLGWLGYLLRTRGDMAGAEPAYRECLEIFERLLPADHPLIARTLNNLATTQHALGKHRQAQESLRRALALNEDLLGKEHLETCNVRLRLGESLSAEGRLAEAEGELLATERVLARAPDDATGLHRKCIEVLVALYENWSESEPGKDYEAKAAEWRAKLESL